MNDQSNDQPNDQPKTMTLTNVETPLDRRRVGDMKIEKFGGLTFVEYREAVEFAKVMTQARHTIPRYLKHNVADCLAVVTQSLRWNLEPFFVAQHSYVAKKDDPDSPIAFDAAVFSAIVTASGVLKERPRYTYAGQGDDRTCTVTATFVGEKDPHDYTTPPLKQCRPRRNEQGFTKGSPLWDKDPDQQLGYYAMRNFARRHCAEVLGGIYDRDEFEEASQQDDSIVPASPNLLARLAGKMTAGQGFHPDNVQNGISGNGHHAPTESAGERSPKTAPEAPPAAADAQAATAQAAKPKQTRKPKPEPAAAPPAAVQSPVPTAQSPLAAAPPPPAEAPPPADAAPPAEAVVIDPPKPASPRNAEEYLAYLTVWLNKTTDDARIYDRWTEEKDLRGICGVVGQHFDQAKEIKDARLAELEG